MELLLLLIILDQVRYRQGVIKEFKITYSFN